MRRDRLARFFAAGMLLSLLPALLYPVEVRRLDARMLAVRPSGSYVLGLEAVFEGRTNNLALGQQVELPGVTAQVSQLAPDGRPRGKFYIRRAA